MAYKLQAVQPPIDAEPLTSALDVLDEMERLKMDACPVWVSAKATEFFKRLRATKIAADAARRVKTVRDVATICGAVVFVDCDCERCKKAAPHVKHLTLGFKDDEGSIHGESFVYALAPREGECWAHIGGGVLFTEEEWKARQ